VSWDPGASSFDPILDLTPEWLDDESLDEMESMHHWFPEILFLPDPWRSARITSKAMRRLRKEKIVLAPSRPLNEPFDPERWQATWDERYAARESARESARKSDEAWQTAVLHDWFDNYIWPVSIDLTWVVANHNLTQYLAQSIYDNNAFELMPILGDALEEAGCGDDAILQHCRRPGEHFPGCWLLSLVLDKKEPCLSNPSA
jgi:hypothetical protein